MEEKPKIKQNHSTLSFLQTLEKASEDLKVNPIFSRHDPQIAIETILNLRIESDTIFSTDPNLFKLHQLLSSLKTHHENLNKFEGFSPKSFLCRQIAKYRIYQVGFDVQKEILACIDREWIQNFVMTIEEGETEEERVEVLKEFEQRLSRGFDGEFQELILRRKVFTILEEMISKSDYSVGIKEQVGDIMVGLVKFNRNVFVGLVLMGPTVKSLISISSPRSIQILTSLVKLIGIPLIDIMELDGEISTITRILCSSNDALFQIAALNCICEIACFARKEVIEVMLEHGLVEKLVELQSSIHGGDNSINMDQFAEEEGARLGTRMGCEEKENVVNRPFLGCVARFFIQIEVGGGLDQSEREEIRFEILRRIKECSVSEAEIASILAEVLFWQLP